jgi:hypothetical protein
MKRLTVAPSILDFPRSTFPRLALVASCSQLHFTAQHSQKGSSSGGYPRRRAVIKRFFSASDDRPCCTLEPSGRARGTAWREGRCCADAVKHNTPLAETLTAIDISESASWRLHSRRMRLPALHSKEIDLGGAPVRARPAVRDPVHHPLGLSRVVWLHMCLSQLLVGQLRPRICRSMLRR